MMVMMAVMILLTGDNTLWMLAVLLVFQRNLLVPSSGLK